MSMSDRSDRLSTALADRYRIERELGQGGMATVYLAEDLKHHRKVAIKVLKPELAAVLGAERFVQEIETTAQLQHPHILALFDSGEADGFLFYVMPYVEGETLREKLNREKQLGIDDAVKIAVEVADALQYAHEQGVIHRDIKPENILLHAGRPMVADFGIALALSAAAGGRLTESGMSLGTPHYMSPEQATAEKDLSNRSDVYSLGSVLYEMLTGDPPHTGSSAQQLIVKILAEDVKPVTELRKSVPPNVAAAAAKALEKLPADRFATAKAFADALTNPAFTTARAGGPRAPLAASTHRIGWWIRSPWSWGAVAVMACLVASLAIVSARADRHANVTFTEKTFNSEAILSARFAPDGHTLVFSGTAEGESGSIPHVFVIRPEYPEPQRLGPDSTYLLAISSNGELAVLTHAVYNGDPTYEGTLSTMPLGSGAPRELVADVHDADWAPDGKTLAAVRRVNGVDQLEFPVGHVVAKSSGYFSDVRVSPSGSEIALLDHSEFRDDRGAAEILNRGGRVIARSPAHWAVHGMAWRTDGSAVLFSAADGTYSSFAVYALDRDGKEHVVLATAGGITIHDVSANGRWLATQDDIRQLVFAGRRGTTEPKNLGWLDGSAGPVLSADGRWLTFTDAGVTGGPNYTVMLRKTDGSPATRLGEGLPLAFSPDARWVLAAVPTQPAQVVLYPTGPGTPRRLDHGQFESIAYRGGISADGSRYLVCASEPGHANRCYVGSLAGGELKPVTPEGVTSAVLAPDGDHVAAVIGDSAFVFDTRTGGRHMIQGGLTPADRLMRWSPDGRVLWIYRYAPPAVEVVALDPESGRRSALTRVVLPQSSGLRQLVGFTVSDDPDVYAYSSSRQTASLFVVEGEH